MVSARIDEDLTMAKFGDPGFPDETGELGEELRLVLGIAARKVLEGVDDAAFLEWARDAIPNLAPAMLVDVPPQELDREAFWIGVSIWNAAPSLANHYQPSPVPKPGRNDACPCGSGMKYKRCCQRLRPVPDFPALVFWPVIAEVCSKTEVDRMIADPGFPVDGIGLMAECFFENGDYLQVIRMLEPPLTGGAERIKTEHAHWIDMLCDAYDEQYRTPRKKLALLDKMTKHRLKFVQGEAWQRLCSIRIDEDDFGGAHEAFAAAMRAQPDNPLLPILELTLLGSLGEIDQARRRARFWLQKWEGHEDELPELIATLRRAVSDPMSALQLSIARATGDDRIERLERWLSASLERSAIGWGTEACGKLDVHGDDSEKTTWTDLEAVTLMPPPALGAALQAWRAAAEIGKPFATSLDPMDYDSPWDDADEDAWLTALELHPEAIDHLDILDDLVLMLREHPLAGSVYGIDDMIPPLLLRARRIVEASPIGEGRILPWGFMENRPGLRLLTQLVLYYQVNGALSEAVELSQWLLELNPEDNQGLRAMLINHYLQAGNYADALELAQRYTRDFLVDVTYGRVLALFALGRREEADTALGKAVDRSPLVAQYLGRARVVRPEFHDAGISVGGPDEAWLYRDEMRDTWNDTKGAMPWLKQTARNRERL
jgi:tetratricopeptide (TPR) repeat protein